jgi:hypothetical protein
METIMRNHAKLCRNQPSRYSFHLMPESIIGLDALLLAVIIIHLGKAKDIKGKLQAIIIVEKLNAARHGKHDISVILDGQSVDNAGVLANPISRSCNPVISRSR